MRTFEHFNNPAEDVCPICQTNADYPIVLMPIGCGYAGYVPADIAPMFTDAPDNVFLPPVFKQILKETP